MRAHKQTIRKASKQFEQEVALIAAKPKNSGTEHDTKRLARENGEYRALCRETTVMAAAANGHSQVFPEARMTVKDGWAFFYRDGKEVWNCNAAYAMLHFDVRPDSKIAP